MEYKIISRHDLRSLEEDVNLAIKERWEPIGSLVWSYSPASNPYGNYVQTMIKN